MGNPDSIHICLFGDERSVHTRRWVTALRDFGHQVDFVTLIKDPKHNIGGIGLGAASKIDYFSKILPLKTLIRKLNPEILHAHQATSYGFLASFVDHPRKILSVWGDDVVVFPQRNFVFKAMIRRSIQKANYITATSEFLKKAVLELSPPAREIKVVPFGIDPDFLRPVERTPRKTTTIGIVKWLTYKYGIDILIQAFHRIVQTGRDVRLVIAGNGPDEADFRQLTSNLKLEDKVIFYGFLESELLPKFLADIDIFAMPSVSDGESFGVAALEAAATCLPVVATRVGGVPEVVVDGVTGFMVERRDPEKLAMAIIKLIDNPGLRLKMGIAGRDFVESKYRWANNVSSMVDLYREVMK